MSLVLDQEFVGLDVIYKKKIPSRSLENSFPSIETPKIYSDLKIIIGMFGFYSQWLYLFGVQVIPHKKLLKSYLPVGTP